MVSLTQMGKLRDLHLEGWVSVGGPFSIDETPIGGPTILMNARQDVIQVTADGTVTRLGPKFSRGRLSDAKEAILLVDGEDALRELRDLVDERLRAATK